VTAEEKVRQLEAQLDRAKRDLEDQRAADRRTAAGEVARLATTRWQYAFVRVRDLDAEAFVQLLQEREGRGWEYNGQTTLKKEAVWLFRRAASPVPASEGRGASATRPASAAARVGTRPPFRGGCWQ
jgi:hypothetical protein